MKANREKTGVSRRGFLGTAAAFSIMAKRTAFGSEANSRITAGIIGLGQRGRLIADMLQKHGGYRITDVADYFPEVAREAGEALSVPPDRCYSGLHGYRRLLDRGVDAVFLETPPYCFPEHVRAAVEKGCHVFMAKPVACDAPGCLAVLEAGKKAGANHKVFLVDFQTRTDPLFIEGIKRVRRGDIGKVGMLGSIYTDEGFLDPPRTDTIESRLRQLIWVNDDALGGGYLVNAGIHAIDVALWIAGDKPVRVMGCSRLVRNEPHSDSHDVYSLTYEFKNGLVLNHWGEHLKNHHYFKCECAAFGQTGYLEAGYSGQVKIHGGAKPFEGGPVEDLYPRGAMRNIETFHKSIINGVYDNPTLEPSVNANLTVILGREAATRNTSLTWEDLLRENRRLEVDTTGLKK